MSYAVQDAPDLAAGPLNIGGPQAKTFAWDWSLAPEFGFRVAIAPRVSSTEGSRTMKRPRWWLVAPALLASAVLNVASAAEIRDKASLFSPAAVQQAQAELDRYEKQYAVPVTIETVDSLDGVPIGQAIQRRAEAVNADGVYILIPKADHKILVEANKHYGQYLTRTRMKAVEDDFLNQFRQRDFNAGLTQGVAKLGSVFAEAQKDSGGSIRQNSAPNVRRGAAAGPGRPAPARRNQAGGFSLMWLIVGGLVLFFLFRIIGSIFGGRRNAQYGQPMMGGRGGYPGPGGPGYGGGYGGAPAGGGGFMSSLFGGIGGAMAGNWLYDRMSGHNQGGGYTDQTGYDSGTQAPLEDTSSGWANNDTGGDWGGGGVADQGGDWGGGGGDWGGGGGGDWGGGGGDDGGSW